MKKYTQEEFDNFSVDENGYKVCPSGDYSGIKEFGDCCIFGDGCCFGEKCRFGEWCSFGKCCSFGEGCSFGLGCRFDEQCDFGKCCSFGKVCRFGECCRFGKWCDFGKGCSFCRWCIFCNYCGFGECCEFGRECKIEGIYELKKLFKAEGLGSRERMTYFFLLTDGDILVRCGCFLGFIEDFEKQVKETHGESKYAREYLMCAELAKLHFKGEVACD